VEWPIEPITTERLTIRDARASDAELFERLYSDPQVRALREVTDGGPVIAVTQAANVRSVALLRTLGMTERERFVEFGAEQVLMSTFLPADLSHAPGRRVNP